MNKAQKIRFAIVGCGNIGRRHIEEIKANKNAKLVAICDINQDLKEANTSVPFYNNIDILLNDNIDIDVVSICTPNGLHASQSLLALEHCHVLVEKPMALNVYDAGKMIHKEKETGNHLFCVMQNRYSPPAVWLRSVINKNMLGTIYMVNLNCFWNRDDRYYSSADWRGSIDLDGGTLYTQFSHFIDVLFYLFNEVKLSSVNLANFNHNNITEFEDSGILTFTLDNKAIGSLQFSTAVYEKNMESSITIIGEKGSVKIGGQYMDQVEYCNIEDYILPDIGKSNNANDYGDYQGSANNHSYVIQNVINTLQGVSAKDATPLECLNVIAFIEEVYKNFRSHN